MIILVRPALRYEPPPPQPPPTALPSRCCRDDRPDHKLQGLVLRRGQTHPQRLEINWGFAGTPAFRMTGVEADGTRDSQRLAIHADTDSDPDSIGRAHTRECPVGRRRLLRCAAKGAASSAAVPTNLRQCQSSGVCSAGLCWAVPSPCPSLSFENACCTACRHL